MIFRCCDPNTWSFPKNNLTCKPLWRSGSTDLTILLLVWCWALRKLLSLTINSNDLNILTINYRIHVVLKNNDNLFELCLSKTKITICPVFGIFIVSRGLKKTAKFVACITLWDKWIFSTQAPSLKVLRWNHEICSIICLNF